MFVPAAFASLCEHGACVLRRARGPSCALRPLRMPAGFCVRMARGPVHLARNTRIRPDGLHVHDMYLMQVKSPYESKYPWDYYKHIATVPGDQAFSPVVDGACPGVR